MKKLQILVVCGLVIQASSLFGSASKAVKPLYKKVNFDNPVRDSKVGGISPENDPEPSEVVFFNGDIEQYEKDLLVKYPEGSCLADIYNESPGSTHFGSNRQASCRVDYSWYQRREHYLWDIATQQKISDSLDSKSDFETRCRRANSIKIISKAICCWKMRDYFFPDKKSIELFFGKKIVSELTPLTDPLTEKVKAVREKIYLEMKKTGSNFETARNDLLENLPNYEEETLRTKLQTAYAHLKNKIELNMIADRLTKEARWYQAGIALQVLAVGVAIYNRKALTKYAGYGLAKFMSCIR